MASLYYDQNWGSCARSINVAFHKLQWIHEPWAPSDWSYWLLCCILDHACLFAPGNTVLANSGFIWRISGYVLPIYSWGRSLVDLWTHYWEVAPDNSECFDLCFGSEYLVAKTASYFSTSEIETNLQDLIERVLWVQRLWLIHQQWYLCQLLAILAVLQ